MVVRKMTVVIQEFDNAAMVDDRTGEVVRMLTELASQIQEYGVVNADGVWLRDINGNAVGSVSVEWDDDESYDDSEE